jgi:hypothetical protein
MNSIAFRLPRADFPIVVPRLIYELLHSAACMTRSPLTLFFWSDATSAGTVGVDLALVPESEHLEPKRSNTMNEYQHFSSPCSISHSIIFRPFPHLCVRVCDIVFGGEGASFPLVVAAILYRKNSTVFDAESVTSYS